MRNHVFRGCSIPLVLKRKTLFLATFFADKAVTKRFFTIWCVMVVEKLWISIWLFASFKNFLVS